MSNEARAVEEYEATRRQQNAEIIRQLNAGELVGRVKVIMILGPTGAGKTNVFRLLTEQAIPLGHSMASGTIDAACVMTALAGQNYLFIDTPGFGHPDLPLSSVEATIHQILGYFTRALGGVHGFFYIQDARDSRRSLGMKQSIQFLEGLGIERIRSRVAFITTKWDLVVDMERQGCVDRKNELIASDWSAFRVGHLDGASQFELGVCCDRSKQADVVQARENFVARVLNIYQTLNHERLVMPFSEWSTSEKIDEVLGYVGIGMGVVAGAAAAATAAAAVVIGGVVTVAIAVSGDNIDITAGIGIDLF